MHTSIVIAAMFSAFAFGCTVKSNGTAAPDGGTAPTADGGAAAGPIALTCGGIFDCAAKCEAAGTPCDEACLAKGSASAQTAVTGLVSCSDANTCTDSACLQERCATEIAACVQPPNSGAKPLEGSVPTGNVPAELVAVWKGNEESIELRADGTVGRTLRIRAATCTYEGLENGVAVADATTLTLYFTSGSFKDCGGPSKEPYKPVTESFTYTLDADSGNTALRLTKLGCTPGNNCVNGYDKY